jgi:hypothetical protein
MHNAPSVIYPVGRCAFAYWLFAVLALLLITTLTLWAWQQSIGPLWCVGLTLSLFALGWGWQCVRATGFSLAWDGQAWCLFERNGSVLRLGNPVCITFDAQHALLLQWMTLSTGDIVKTRWLWLSGSADPANWQNLRRALYSYEHFS